MKIDYNNPDQITVEYVLELDAYKHPPVWLREDYLSMRGICYGSDRPMYNWLDRLADIKQAIRIIEDYDFNVDKL